MVSAYQLFATTVGLITTVSPSGRPNVMACEWSMNVCWNPLAVLAVVHRENLTHDNISDTGEFGFSLCAENQTPLAHLAGSVTGRDHDKLSHPVFAPLIGESRSVRPPLIEGGVVTAECAVEQTIDLGEYTGFVGTALHTEIDPDRRPLLWHRSGYYTMGDRIPKPAMRS